MRGAVAHNDTIRHVEPRELRGLKRGQVQRLQLRGSKTVQRLVDKGASSILNSGEALAEALCGLESGEQRGRNWLARLIVARVTLQNLGLREPVLCARGRRERAALLELGV